MTDNESFALTWARFIGSRTHRANRTNGHAGGDGIVRGRRPCRAGQGPRRRASVTRTCPDPGTRGVARLLRGVDAAIQRHSPGTPPAPTGFRVVDAVIAAFDGTGKTPTCRSRAGGYTASHRDNRADSPSTHPRWWAMEEADRATRARAAGLRGVDARLQRAMAMAAAASPDVLGSRGTRPATLFI